MYIISRERELKHTCSRLQAVRADSRGRQANRDGEDLEDAGEMDKIQQMKVAFGNLGTLGSVKRI